MLLVVGILCGLLLLPVLAVQEIIEGIGTGSEGVADAADTTPSDPWFWMMLWAFLLWPLWWAML